MMITKVVLKNFKRFQKQTFEIEGNMILAGQNNFGKTTLIQAISAWHYALRKWPGSGRERGIDMSLDEFSPVPLHEFNQLWTNKSTGYRADDLDEQGKKPHSGAPRPLVIEVSGEHQGDNWSCGMQITYNNRKTVYVRPVNPKAKISEHARELKVMHIPSVSGINLEEHVVTPAYQDRVIGREKPGEILCNLLLEAQKRGKWGEIKSHIKDIFGYEILPPESKDAILICEYRKKRENRWVKLNIASAGSGFRQTLILLASLYARPASVILLDEPDAHLHFSLQGQIYDLLGKIADEHKSQLIIATHSEVLIKETSPQNIISFFRENPRRLVTSHERGVLIHAIKSITSMDLLEARKSGGKVLFLEGETDLAILRKMASVLEHPLAKWLSETAYVHFLRGKDGAAGKVEEHIKALKADFKNIKGFLLLDSDNTAISGRGRNAGDPLQVGYWKRHEIENYIVHPDAIRRFLLSRLESSVGPLFVEKQAEKGMETLHKIIQDEFFEDPVNDPHGYMDSVKTSVKILPRVFEAAGLRGINKADYYRLAEKMRPKEFSPEVKEKLDSIARHFGLIK